MAHEMMHVSIAVLFDNFTWETRTVRNLNVEYDYNYQTGPDPDDILSAAEDKLIGDQDGCVGACVLEWEYVNVN